MNEGQPQIILFKTAWIFNLCTLMVNEKSRIVLVGPCYPYRGGNALFMAFLYRALAERFDVHLVNFTLLYPSLLFPGQTQYDESDDHYLQVPSERKINSINPISWAKTAQHINALEPDLVAFDWWQPFFGPAYRAISRKLNVGNRNKILFITENFISHEARAIDKMLTTIGLKHADMFLALSQKVEDELNRANYRQPVFRSELPVYGWYQDAGQSIIDQLRDRIGWSTNDRVVLFFGYVRVYKGLDILIRAISSLQQIDPRYKLLVAGEFYDSPETYYDLAADICIDGSVHFENQYIPNEEVGKYFDLADVVVLPYRNGTQSGILNIAYGHHKPVVITDVGGLAEFVEDGVTGVIVPTAEPQVVADGITRFYELAEEVPFRDHVDARVNANGFNTIADRFDEMLEL